MYITLHKKIYSNKIPEIQKNTQIEKERKFKSYMKSEGKYFFMFSKERLKLKQQFIFRNIMTNKKIYDSCDKYKLKAF